MAAGTMPGRAGPPDGGEALAWPAAGDLAIDPARCPLCGASNRCLMADPATREAAQAGTLECWCVGARIDPAQLARVPPEARLRACLCPACAAGLDAVSPPAG